MESHGPDTGSTVRPLIGAGAAGPAPADLDLFATAHQELAPVEPGRAAARRHRAPSRPAAVAAAVAVAVAGVVATVGIVVLVSGLFGGTDSSDGATPDENASVPQLIIPAIGAPSASPSQSAGASASAGGATASGTALKSGSRGAGVVELQGRLRQLQLYDGPQDGKYDAAVRYAVLRFQKAYDVQGDADGVYGADTRSALESRTTYN